MGIKDATWAGGLLMKKVKLIILDIDGVLTDGKKYYGLDGMPFAKTYCDKDFTAIKRFRGAGINVCFLSGDKKVNEEMAKNRNIDFYAARQGENKTSYLSLLETVYSVKKENMLYVGDDLFDKDIMQQVGFAYCPKDACIDILSICDTETTIPRNGGDSVISYLQFMLRYQGLIPDCSMSEIEKLDAKEIF